MASSLIISSSAVAHVAGARASASSAAKQVSLAAPAPAARNVSLAGRFAGSGSLTAARRERTRDVTVLAGKENMDQEAMEAQIKEAMKNPEVAKRVEQMQEMMKNPSVQGQMAQMQKVMMNPDFQAKMMELKEDPELKPMWDEIAAKGPMAMMKYYQDPNFIKKINEKMGDMTGVMADAGIDKGSPAEATGQEIETIFDAAKFDDMEALDDFLAVGKDVNEQDGEGRTAAHYACAFGRANVLTRLIEVEGLNLELEDSKGNTALHYACGYGRADLVPVLIDAGASKAATNSTGKTPLELAQLDENNPVTKDESLVSQLN